MNACLGLEGITGVYTNLQTFPRPTTAKTSQLHRSIDTHPRPILMTDQASQGPPHS